MNKGLYGIIGRAIYAIFRPSRKRLPETPKNSPGQDATRSPYCRESVHSIVSPPTIVLSRLCPYYCRGVVPGRTRRSPRQGSSGTSQKPGTDYLYYNTRATVRFIDWQREELAEVRHIGGVNLWSNFVQGSFFIISVLRADSLLSEVPITIFNIFCIGIIHFCLV